MKLLFLTAPPLPQTPCSPLGPRLWLQMCLSSISLSHKHKSMRPAL